MEQIPDTVRLIDLKAPRVICGVFPLIKYLKREHPIAIISAMYANIIALWARRICGIPQRIIITEHNTLSSVLKNKTDLRWHLYPKFAQWFYPWAENIIAVSNAVKDDLSLTARIPQDLIQVIYNPVITPDLKVYAEKLLEHPWFKEGEPPVILAVGRLTDQKAFDVLIRAFSLVRKNHNAHLLILGEGENRPTLQSLISQLGLKKDVDMIGFVQNPYPFIARATVLVLPSRWEGLPTVLIEALYLETPIVATDCPGGSREILKGGQYGMLVPVDEPLILANAIEEVIEDRVYCSREDSCQSYKLDFIVDCYVNLLHGVN